ncbi:MAG: hypothetical protein HWQ35_05925 [Nostoc sp. NMS1]|uniref:hypothetical protein n=1 Tax=unclassified Nostoc TaxID=2593658 RepID=UPI0025CE54E5|nr:MULTISPECIES: hypothetical protein [unclassified Nostoc]MBN3906100.1 hypothetical protein [Nostoc sp. NMS1]MBN3991838.1 hypothetical protein [Nostoc sp. NMS2]
MASIQITDLNSSKSELLYELTNAELLDINGGGWFSDVLGVAMIVTGIFTSSVGIGTALIAGGVSIINGGSGSSGGSRGGGGVGGGLVRHMLE